MCKPRWVKFECYNGKDIWVRADLVVAVNRVKSGGTCIHFGNGLEFVVRGDLGLVQKVVEFGRKEVESNGSLESVIGAANDS